MAIPITADVIIALIPLPPADRVKLLDEAERIRRWRKRPRVDLAELDEAREFITNQNDQA